MLRVKKREANTKDTAKIDKERYSISNAEHYKKE